MPPWLGAIVAIGSGIGIVWLLLVAVLVRHVRRTGRRMDWRALARLVPDVLGLIRRIVADPSAPRSTRWILGLLLLYLLLPIDLVPDVIPVIGWADDAIVAAIALRFVIRRAGTDAIDRHWAGEESSKRALLTLVGLEPRTPES